MISRRRVRFHGENTFQQEGSGSSIPDTGGRCHSCPQKPPGLHLSRPHELSGEQVPRDNSRESEKVLGPKAEKRNQAKPRGAQSRDLDRQTGTRGHATDSAWPPTHICQGRRIIFGHKTHCLKAFWKAPSCAAEQTPQTRAGSGAGQWRRQRSHSGQKNQKIQIEMEKKWKEETTPSEIPSIIGPTIRSFLSTCLIFSKVGNVDTLA